MVDPFDLGKQILKIRYGGPFEFGKPSTSGMGDLFDFGKFSRSGVELVHTLLVVLASQIPIIQHGISETRTITSSTSQSQSILPALGPQGALRL